MPNPLRFIPPEGALVEVTCTTIQRRLLLTPRHRLREITIGALARAKAKQENPLHIVAFSFLSSHFHLLLWVQDAQTLTSFMFHFNSKMGKEIKRLTGWGGKIWGWRRHGESNPGAGRGSMPCLRSRATRRNGFTLVHLPSQAKIIDLGHAEPLQGRAAEKFAALDLNWWTCIPEEVGPDLQEMRNIHERLKPDSWIPIERGSL